MYDPTIGRWLGVDPYDEFASPYVGMGADPVNNVDPDGGGIWDALKALFGGASSGGQAIAGVPCSNCGAASNTGTSAGSPGNGAANLVVGYLAKKLVGVLFPLPKGPDAKNLPAPIVAKPGYLQSIGPDFQISQPTEQTVITSYDPDAPVSEETMLARKQRAIEQYLKRERESSIGYGILDKAGLTIQMIPGVKQMLGNEKAVHINGDDATTDETVGGMINTASFFVPVGQAEKVVEEGGHLVYQGFDKAGVVRYVGRTVREATIRFGEHLSATGTGRELLRYEVIPAATNLTKISARIWEQKLINQFGLGKNGGLLLNKINSIAEKFWKEHGIK